MKNTACRSQSPQKTPAYRSVSPTRMLDPKPNSPFKPHPLQFISPQKNKSPAKNMTPTASEVSWADGPPKPQRIFTASGTTSTLSNMDDRRDVNLDPGVQDDYGDSTTGAYGGCYSCGRSKQKVIIILTMELTGHIKIACMALSSGWSYQM